MRADERVKRSLYVAIDCARSAQCRVRNRKGTEEHKFFVIAQKLLADANIGIRQRFRIYYGQFFVKARFAEVLTIKWTKNIDFALITAADRANIAVNSGAMAPRPARITDSTQFRHESSG